MVDTAAPRDLLIVANSFNNMRHQFSESVRTFHEPVGIKLRLFLHQSRLGLVVGFLSPHHISYKWVHRDWKFLLGGASGIPASIELHADIHANHVRR